MALLVPIVIAANGVVLLSALLAKAQPASSGCDPSLEPTPLTAVEFVPVSLAPEQGEGLIIPLGRNRVPTTRRFFLKPAVEGEPEEAAPALPPERTVLTVIKRPLKRQEVDAEIRAIDYEATAVVTALREVTLIICIDPAKAGIHPGTYKGEVRIVDPRVQDVTIPLTITAQYPGYRWMVLLYGVGLLGPGSLFVWATARRTTGRPIGNLLRREPRKGLWEWALPNLVAFVPPAVAAGGVFIASYWRDPAWGAKAPEDWFQLFAAMFTAYSTALAASTALGTKVAPSEPGGGVAGAASASADGS